MVSLGQKFVGLFIAIFWWNGFVSPRANFLPELHVYKFMLVGSHQVYSYIFAQKTFGTNLYSILFQSLIHTFFWLQFMTSDGHTSHGVSSTNIAHCPFRLPLWIAISAGTGVGRCMFLPSLADAWQRTREKKDPSEASFVHFSSLLLNLSSWAIISGNVLTLGEPSFLFISLDLWNRAIWIWVGWIQHAA